MKRTHSDNPQRNHNNHRWLLAALTLFWLVGCNHRVQDRSSSPSVRPELLEKFEKIRSLGLHQEKAHEFLRLVTSVGGRLTGSSQADRAVELTARLMTELGFDRVWTEPVKVGHWVRGEKELATIRSSKLGTQSLEICALGHSLGTAVEGLEAGLVEVRSFEELASLKDKISGRIVFFNVPMNRTVLEPFAAYGQAASFRVHGASEAARYGARAVLIRSMTFRLDHNPHTGLMEYDERQPRIPAAAISTAGAELLHSWLQVDPELKVWLRMNCRQEEPVTSANVIGQLTGSEFPEEIILVGGHLDSWDLSPGAHDDAAGCAVAIEVLRLIKETGLKPKRTIRAVLFMDEEFGGTGGRAYAASDNRNGEKHLVAIEQDRGGAAPLGLAFSLENLLDRLKPLLYYLEPMGINWLRTGGGGVDIAPLQSKGTILGGLIPESQRYFDYHHGALDGPETVHPRELELQAVILAIVIYFLAEEGV
ncbi:MAG: M20/M25/M40 family metallo-hydrolase [Candidatus Saccharicenans sp.]|nr:M20/M25/M40 family metallo-hydrolase [Candidatus Saccharicenans sp.]